VRRISVPFELNLYFLQTRAERKFADDLNSYSALLFSKIYMLQYLLNVRNGLCLPLVILRSIVILRKIAFQRKPNDALDFLKTQY
jgi:hypothetical protein